MVGVFSGRGASAVRPIAPRLRVSRWVMGIVFAAVPCIPPGSAGAADARLAAGTLSCVIDAGKTPLLGNDRAVTCTYMRTGATAELYEGLTGIVTVARPGAQTVVFDVAMRRPDALAALAGDYTGEDFAAPGGALLVGGPEDSVTLMPIRGHAATDAAALNALLRLSQLHLNYAGRIAPYPAPARVSSRGTPGRPTPRP